MKFCDNTTERSPARRYTATALGVITLICAVAVVLLIASDLFTSGGYGGMAAFFLLIITLPFTLLCTLFAILLVGTRRCKLAWI
jgi:uncharacterized membrane protein YkgB